MEEKARPGPDPVIHARRVFFTLPEILQKHFRRLPYQQQSEYLARYLIGVKEIRDDIGEEAAQELEQALEKKARIRKGWKRRQQ